MHLDVRGLPVTVASAKAGAAYDHLVTGYLTYRADTPARLAALLQADPDCPLAHCMKGYFAMLGFKQAVVPVAVDEARTAQSLAADATPRERGHIAALTAWSEGELDRAIASWEAILRTHPHDLVAFRLAHFVNFWLGRPQDMVASVEGVMPDWSEDIPGYSTLLACRCFAPRGGWQLSRRRALRTPRHRARSRRSLGRARGRPRDGDAGAPQRRYPVAHDARAELGGQPQPAAPSLVALRAVQARARRSCRRARALRYALPRPRRAAHGRLAGCLHRRAERGVHALPPPAPRHRRREPLGGTGRQGRGADRRLRLGVHAAALADGADRYRDAPPQRSG